MISSRLILSLIVLALALFCFADAKDYYGILGIERDSTEQQVKKAFRRLSMKYHPDKNPNNPEAHDKFLEINEANDVLSNSEKRRTYDIDGYEALNRPQHQSNDPFAMMFGGGNQGRPRGPNAMTEMRMTLEQLYSGTEASIQIERNVLCSKCRGSGAKDGATQRCTACQGRGMVTKTQSLGPGFQVQMQQPCDVCQGKGNVAKNKCPHCEGRRVTREKKSLKAVIERGMKDGHQIVFERESEQSPSTTPGDVIAVVRQVPHHRFRRENDDLHMDLNITLKESLLGFTKSIPHLDNHQVTVTRDGVTEAFHVITVANEGMPQHGTPSIKGNLIIRVIVMFPNALNQNQKDVVNRLL